MATEKWVAGGQAAFAAAFGTELQSVVNGNAVLSGVQIDNTANLDMFAEVDFRCGSVTTTGNPFLALYGYPLLDDNATFGDGRFASSAAGPPPASYFLGMLGLPVGTQALSGLFARPDGAPMILKPYKFKLVFYNSAGVTLPASGITCDYRTFNRQVA
jgi:hypothetical protein